MQLVTSMAFTGAALLVNFFTTMYELSIRHPYFELYVHSITMFSPNSLPLSFS